MLQATHLHKRYGRVRALDGLSLSVPRGAIYGLIGQNGAGKTTSIRILATLALPDQGEVQVDGIDALRRPYDVRRVIGYMPDFFGVYDDLRVGEYVEFYGALSGVKGAGRAGLRDRLLELVDLTDKRDAFVHTLSRGMQQRLCLARALVHDPTVLLLDEPASGLDPVARVEMRALLHELAKMGKTILVSSHILAELADLCTHVGMMVRGQMVRQGTVQEVLWAAERPGYELRVLRDADRAASLIRSLDGFDDVSLDEETVHFRCAGGAEDAARALAIVVAEGIPVARFAQAAGSLEATFISLLGRDTEESAVNGAKAGVAA